MSQNIKEFNYILGHFEIFIEYYLIMRIPAMIFLDKCTIVTSHLIIKRN